MKKENEKLERDIRTAMEHAAPDKLDEILSSCGRQEKKAAAADRRKAPRRIWGIAAAAVALCLCLAASGLYLQGRGERARTGAGQAVILLDVNPSLSMTVDKKEVVTEVTPLNGDGRTVLGDMDLKGTDMEVALNAIVGSMLKNGYLNELQNSILVSVEDADEAQAAVLQEKVRTSIDTAMKDGSVDGAVLSQTVTADGELEQLAGRYGISVGKAAMIKEAVEKDNKLKFEDLAGMSITEIALLMDSRNIVSDKVVLTGAASDKAYIGGEEAQRIAFADAGLEAASVVRCRVELDSDGGVFLYEVEFSDGKTDYDYDVDAGTGKILKREKQKNAGTVPGQTPGGSLITLEDARAKALAAAGVNAADAVFRKEKADRENGIDGYEFEFTVGETRYEYFVAGGNGEILKEEAGPVSGDDGPDGDRDDGPDDDDDRDDGDDDIDSPDDPDEPDDDDGPEDALDDDGPDDEPDDDGPDDDDDED